MKVSTSTRKLSRLGVIVLFSGVVAILAGCGAEAVKPAPPAAPAGTAPGGGSSAEYEKKMKEIQSGGNLRPK